uniref:Uncharacterized protein n=1 Tax=Rhizophora mucronata TaxID=61149 RepID=A0A2P2N2W6_RHIMU
MDKSTNFFQDHNFKHHASETELQGQKGSYLTLNTLSLERSEASLFHSTLTY